MRQDNIFQVGGEVTGDSVIGYRTYHATLRRSIEQRILGTGGLYLYGLYRMGKTSLIKSTAVEIEASQNNLIYLYIVTKDYKGENAFSDMLEAIIRQLKRKLCRFPETNLSYVSKTIEYFEQDKENYILFREDFKDIFKNLKEAGMQVLLVLDEFDYAREIFKTSSDFELFRELTAASEISVCLVTVSRQELCYIEQANPYTSTFKVVMQPFAICGFEKEDIADYQKKMQEFYDISLSEEMLEALKFYCGTSPYLWSCFGYEIAEKKISTPDSDFCFSIEEFYHVPSILSKINAYHDSVFKCLKTDKDTQGNSFIDKLTGIVIGPSFFVTESDFTQLESLHYLIDNGTEYIPISGAFKTYLTEHSHSNDILNNFEVLEKKLKVILESEKSELCKVCHSSSANPDSQWYDILQKPYRNGFISANYQKQIDSTRKRFSKTVTALDVMSLEDATKIIKSFWSTFSKYFSHDALKKWETKLTECGKARNPVHHGTKSKLYTPEEQIQINSYCCEIIKQLP